MIDYQIYTNILKRELIPALGCTEPISIAYGAAVCKQYLSGSPTKVTIQCSGNIIKNVKGVVVPNTNGMKGIQSAVAVGMLCGDASQGLEVLSAVDASRISEVEQFLKKDLIKVSLLDSDAKLHFIITMHSDHHSSRVEIMDEHTHIVSIMQDGNPLFEKELLLKESSEESLDSTTLTVEKIVDYCEHVDIEAISPIIERQIAFNTAICEEGLSSDWGAKIGKHILHHQGSGLLSRLKAVTAAGSDARMSGCVYPVIINSGSGNQGITSSIPVIEFAKNMHASQEQTIRALALSNLIAIHHKSKIGSLSAYCGVSTAGAGSGAAMTWLAGGTLSQINDTISNSLAAISGMICDGAKPSCAAKIALAVESAYVGHCMAMESNTYKAGDGIVKNSIEETISGVGEIASLGMNETDKVILSVMLS